MLEDPFLAIPFVFLARVTDVSMATLRTILIVRGAPYRAAAIGFFEVLVWVAAASQVLGQLDRWYVVLGYAAGFATGNIVGIRLEARLAIGSELIRIISRDPSIQLTERLRELGYSVTELSAEDDGGAAVEVLLIVCSRRRVAELLGRVRAIDPKAIWTISDVKRVGVEAVSAAEVVERNPRRWVRQILARR